MLSLFVGASSTMEGLECQTRRRRTQSNRWSRRGPSPVLSSLIDKLAVRWCRLNQGFCGAGAALDGYGKRRSENGARGRRNRPSAGTVFGSGDGGRNTSDEYPWGSSKALEPYTWLVCGKVENAVEVRGRPPKAACSVRGTSRPKTVTLSRSPSSPNAVLSVWGTNPPKPVPSARGVNSP